jgi:hypothetical protein
MIACLYVSRALPYIARESMANGEGRSKKRSTAFLGPVKILVPQRLRLANGQIKRYFGVIFLSLGIFLGVVS